MGVGRSLLTMTAFLAVLPAATGEIVHFKSGSTMAVIDHTVEDGMIRLVLGPESQIAFPIEMVERITIAGKEVFPSAGGDAANRRVPSTPVVDTTVTGRPPSAYTRGQWIGNETPSNPRVSRDKVTGLAVYDPAEGGARVVGQLDMLTGKPPSGLQPDPVTGQRPPVVGARPFGRGYIGSLPGDTNPARRLLLSMTASDNPGTPPPPVEKKIGSDE